MQNLKSKVGIIFNLSCYGGVQTCVITLIKGLNDLGIKPDLLTDERINHELIKENSLLLNEKEIKFSISFKKFEKFGKYLIGFQDFIYFYKISWLKDEYDFIYIFQHNVIIDKKCNYLFYLSMSPLAYGYSNNPLSYFKIYFYKYFICHFHPIYDFKNRNCVINSHYTQNYFIEYYKKSIEVIYPPISIKATNLSNNTIKEDVLFLSRIVPQKRVELFLELAKKYSFLKFRIVGHVDNNAYLARLKEFIKKNNLSNVTFSISPPQTQILHELLRAKFYVFTAKNEHFGIATVEAMTHGVIPFVHDSGGQKEIVPYENLRFTDNDYIFKFGVLLKHTNEELSNIKSLILSKSHQFSNEIFLKSMLIYLKNYQIEK